MGKASKYLAYGSNLHPLRLRERQVSVELVQTVPLPNWQLGFHKVGRDGSAKCSISPSSAPNAVVWCALYHIDLASIARLDRIEGLGSGYERRHLQVDGHGTAYTYVASRSATSQELRPFTWYRELVVAGAVYHSFPDLYVAELQATHAAEDPDRARAARHIELLRRLTSG